MPTCPACGATVAGAAAFCGDCGAALPASASEPGTGPATTTDRLKREIRAQRAAEATGWLTPRSKAVFYLLLGVAGLAVGYWLGFVGYTETTVGPQGYGRYRVTYPPIGLGLLVVGAIAFLVSLLTAWRSRA